MALYNNFPFSTDNESLKSLMIFLIWINSRVNIFLVQTRKSAVYRDYIIKLYACTTLTMIHEIAERHQKIQNEGSYPCSSTRHNNQTRFRFHLSVFLITKMPIRFTLLIYYVLGLIGGFQLQMGMGYHFMKWLHKIIILYKE